MSTIKQLQTLFTKLGIAETERHERIGAWTSGRTESAKELQADELEELYESLVSEFNREKEQLQKVKRLRISAILAIATREGIKHPNNWDSFNRFMLHRSVVKKFLNLCDLEELEQVLTQFRALEQNNAKSAEKAGTKAYFNQFGMPNISKN